MTKRLLLLLAAVGVLAFAAEQVFFSPASDSAVQARTITVTIPVKGMACQEMCGTRVTKALQAIDGTEHVVVSAEEGNARVTYVTTKVTPERLLETINNLGFEAGAPKVEKQSPEPEKR